MPCVRDKAKQRKYERAWYRRNAEKAKTKSKRSKQEIIAWYREYKRTLTCLRCPENDPVTLDFHHRDPSQKDPRISRMW